MEHNSDAIEVLKREDQQRRRAAQCPKCLEPALEFKSVTRWELNGKAAIEITYDQCHCSNCNEWYDAPDMVAFAIEWALTSIKDWRKQETVRKAFAAGEPIGA
jgi:hypothetical protein